MQAWGQRLNGELVVCIRAISRAMGSCEEGAAQCGGLAMMMGYRAKKFTVVHCRGGVLDTCDA
ncbi:hypothetical protein IG631_21813 [Alternaria alternata]|jgi:hypothetical protein|nr:hypothetical protein IG631_21813 [Alternaria alternata]